MDDLRNSDTPSLGPISITKRFFIVGDLPGDAYTIAFDLGTRLDGGLNPHATSSADNTNTASAADTTSDSPGTTATTDLPEIAASTVFDGNGGAFTVASILGTLFDGRLNPPATSSVDTTNSVSDDALTDDILNHTSGVDTTSDSPGTIATTDSPGATATTDLLSDVAEHTNPDLSSTTREILVTSTISPQPGQTATSEVVIIISTTVEPISQSQVPTPQDSDDSTLATSTGGDQQSSNLTGASFFNNKPAFIGTFTVIGIMFLAFMGFLVIKFLRKRKIFTSTAEKGQMYEVVDN
ncbi:hypothetical protein K435DRAFT_801415 [Dendrothele bispora CBS 962.96]|uniref:Uncharacterized protein n=1 Tax=Dendrothele bispora (strain CBS 962.96) TaxID=1314807 RepID=A0A4S8LPL4_DENBC|nr:hypothetical protein K435DRAFT_801415 [Dendrothele bispora CBS 962.96]